MIFNIIQRLRATSKRIEKEAILQSLPELEKLMFLKVAVATYDSSVSYFISAVPKAQYSYHGTMSLDEVLGQLYMLSDRVVTGNKAKEFLIGMCNQLTEDDAEVLRLVIKGNLDCGVNAPTINRVFGDVIYQHPYNRCSGFSAESLANIKLPCLSQIKMDGMYVDIIVNNDNVDVMTRNGQKINHIAHIDTINVLKSRAGDVVFMGEALVLDENGEIMSRKEGNGYLNSDPANIDPSRVRFVLWDMVLYEEWKSRQCNTRYEIRWKTLQRVAPAIPNFQLVNSRTCFTVDDILNHFKAVVEVGEEGTVIKDGRMLWCDGDNKLQIKVKIEFECDLLVVDVVEGEGKHKGKLGALTCTTADGNLIVSVGSGLSDAQREAYFEPDLNGDYPIVGKVITVKANDVITKAGSDKLSLFLPRFIEERKDKTTADTLERVIEQRDSFIHVLNEIQP